MLLGLQGLGFQLVPKSSGLATGADFSRAITSEIRVAIDSPRQEGLFL